MQQVEKHRPFGVTLIAALTIIAGIVFLASGITAVTVAPFLSGTQTLLVGLSAGAGAAFLALGIGYFCYGLWIVKRETVGLDCNVSTIFHWNCIRISFNRDWAYRSCIQYYYQRSNTLLYLQT